MGAAFNSWLEILYCCMVYVVWTVSIIDVLNYMLQIILRCKTKLSNNNKYLAADQHRICKGSCYTEDWDMAAEILLCNFRNKLHKKKIKKI